jgi:hypothetical protein
MRSLSQVTCTSYRYKDMRKWTAIRSLFSRERKQITNLSLIIPYGLWKIPLNFIQPCYQWSSHSLSRMKNHSKNSSKRLSDHHWLHQSVYWRNKKSSQSDILCLLPLNEMMEKSSIPLKKAIRNHENRVQHTSKNGDSTHTHKS